MSSTKKTPVKKLSVKEKRFVKELMLDNNATQAAIRAKYSKPSARTLGCRLLTKVHIQQAIEIERERLGNKLDITPERVLKELSYIGFMNIADAFNKSGELLSIHEMPERIARAIGGIDVSTLAGGDKEEIIKKIKLIDKRGALELIGKHLGMFGLNVNVKGNVIHDHEHKHTHESVSKTADWIEGLLGSDKSSEIKKPRSH